MAEKHLFRQRVCVHVFDELRNWWSGTRVLRVVLGVRQVHDGDQRIAHMAHPHPWCIQFLLGSDGERT